jgi:glyoxylase-like metal-dependent hydrolase (beta-lactamase superfamily II)
MLVIRGLHASETTHGGRAYLVEGSAECVLIDTGGPDGALGVAHLLGAARRAPHEIALILLTHAHPGHAGNVQEVRKLTGARVAASAQTAALLREAGGARPARRSLLGGTPAWPSEPIRVDDVVEPGQVLEAGGGIEVVAAPGHAPGALAFHCYGPTALVFGDAARLGRDGRLHPPPARCCADPAEAATTAGRLAGLGIRVLAPGHGLPIVDGRRPARVPQQP